VQITGFQQFLDILTVPDNIPIIAMMILVMFFTYVALKQGSAQRSVDRAWASRTDYRRDEEVGHQYAI